MGSGMLSISGLEQIHLVGQFALGFLVRSIRFLRSEISRAIACMPEGFVVSEHQSRVIFRGNVGRAIFGNKLALAGEDSGRPIRFD